MEQPAFVKRSGEVNPDTLNKLVNDKRRLEQIVVKLVEGLAWVENHPTVLVDTDLLEAVNFAPGCEDCYNNALEVVANAKVEG